MTSRLTVALPKGRLLDDALELIRELGVDGVDQDSRRLIFDDLRAVGYACSSSSRPTCRPT
jgi:ATP phosphoribosyltransferase